MKQNKKNERNRRKVLMGVVVSTKMQKTATVKVETKTPHPLYKKLVITHKKYHADNRGDNVANVGDQVQIIETRPIAANKCWRINRIIKRAK